MNIAHHIHQMYLTNSLPSLTLDDMLDSQGLTHLKYRNWLKNNGHPLYEPTIGLRTELESYGFTRTEAASKYHMTLLEVNTCIYGRANTVLKRERAAQLTAAGATQLDLISEGLSPNIELLKLEISARREAGESTAYLAQLYGYTKSRISQLSLNKPTKKCLSPEDKLAIKQSTKTAAQLAKQYNTTVNTIYVTRRGN